jgi:hypothetical protein
MKPKTKLEDDIKNFSIEKFTVPNSKNFLTRQKKMALELALESTLKNETTKLTMCMELAGEKLRYQMFLKKYVADELATDEKARGYSIIKNIKTMQEALRLTEKTIDEDEPL